jgi:hypothetical protein
MTTADGLFGVRPHIARPSRKRGRPKLVLDPFRLYRRHSRMERHALEEAQHLRRRYGDMALHIARQKLLRPDLTQWGRKVIKRAIKLLHWQA